MYLDCKVNSLLFSLPCKEKMERDLQWKSGGHKLNVSLISGEALCLCLSDLIPQDLSFHTPFQVFSMCKTDKGTLVGKEKGFFIFSLIPPALALEGPHRTQCANHFTEYGLNSFQF